MRGLEKLNLENLQNLQGLFEIAKGKHILLLVSGSIAVYKSLDLVRAFKKLGACVRVVMSEEAKKFITPLSFEALAHTQVLHTQTESWAQSDGEIACNHIAYAKWAHIAILAPASANTLAKVAHGITDGLVLSTFLACKAPKLIAPAMNTAMLEAPQIKQAIALLQAYGFGIIKPQEALLACDTYGKGALAHIDEIVYNTLRTIHTDTFWQHKEVIITGGGSVENIDSVRYISNHSSGLQASFLALALYLRGAKVTLIASVFPMALPTDIECIKAKDSQTFLSTLKECIPQDREAFLFMAAAISDYVPKESFSHKLKKDAIGEVWHIECQKNIDILQSLTSPYLHKIGFKAESDGQDAPQHAQKMLQSPKDGGKGCAVVCLNCIGTHSPFGAMDNEMTLFSHTHTHHIKRQDKLAVSFEILEFIQKTLC
ncbi:hypothetical protein BKH46_06905 [Helicobacter sp. 12S02634-8]|uniref:bifunctional phosphopantothenoylcysteine decarboxylase/phosphopantothenate--cysteine ligase CoaBC n=1 Tax=Helicobacter sp. 12S02634-8 TaxID=1476199 RepID=UPI000BA60B60|nr:bifunctional phosphopantothenoylcysteine decarboxylase/phosphopantothenate--cysteine ligase CoaBC [Helicobacter sp. 12S02634-8]PAF46690.1 hypothetical protein BKH46_06905 [Helicobacter sp. 12S02634-8]